MVNLFITKTLLLAVALVSAAEAARVPVQSDAPGTSTASSRGGKYGHFDATSRPYATSTGINTGYHSRGHSKVQGSPTSTVSASPSSSREATDKHNRQGEPSSEHPKPSSAREDPSLVHQNFARTADRTTKSQSGADSPQPSPRPRDRQQKQKDPRDMTSRELAKHVCPDGLFGCPIAEPGSLSRLPTNLTSLVEQGFECVDLKADLKACGGCASVDKVHDCTTIPGVQGVSCENGACVVGHSAASLGSRWIPRTIFVLPTERSGR